MSSPITFYSASAGSGKTYTLARDYLTYLFTNPSNHGYRDILAVTFTNKAVAEMKERIMEYLHAFTQEQIPENITGIATYIQETAQLPPQVFRKKATQIYYRLLHDYSAFDIVTIDAFNHRILRTFSKDLKLPDGFEVELDSKRLINKAIQNLIARAGNDKQLTDQLIDFSLTKINDGKSWDIEYDLADISQLILNENHYYHLKKLKNKELKDFTEWRKVLKSNIDQLEKELVQTATPLAEKVIATGLTHADFKGGNRSSPFKAVEKVAAGDFSVLPNSASIRDLLSGDLYAKGKATHIKDAIDNFKVDFEFFASLYCSHWGSMQLYRDLLNNLTPLSLLNEILSEIELIKVSEKILPIYEFNGLLAEQIKDQPAPFIYERLGERYKHFFIDEFQDTSVMQWENMSPLISNALLQEQSSSSPASLMLVGDAKQSIYRWRGGDVNQFLKLLEEPQLFYLDKHVNNLDYNWRSYDQIIGFNNSFFDYYGDYLQSDTYKNLYKNYLKQKNRSKPGGFIQIDFIDKEAHKALENDQVSTAYPAHVHGQVLQAISNGFLPGEICVLVRSNKHANEIATYLVTQGISVVSGESLLVKQSLRVQLMVHYMHMILQPFQQEPRYQFLLIYSQLKEIDEVHEFLNEHINLTLEQLLKQLVGEKGNDLSSAFAKAPLFKAAEDAACHLGLLEDLDTRLQTFLNFIFEYTTGYEVSLSGFLEEWSTKEDKLSVPAMPDNDAVQVMTIHKSKGLEFPVVIVPHCDDAIQDTSRDKGWITINPDSNAGFEEAFLNLKSNLQYYPTPCPEVLELHALQSQMDTINVLYVAFTRAREQLYISCTDKPESATVKKDATALNYAQILKRFRTGHGYDEYQEEGFTSLKIGTQPRTSTLEIPSSAAILKDYSHSLEGNSGAISTRKGMLWSTETGDAIDKGNQLHYYLSLLETKDQIHEVLKEIDRESSLTNEDKIYLQEKITTLLNHPETSLYFKPDYEVFNEQKILMPNGVNLIPDRLLIKEGLLTIIDYKTGGRSDRHIEQLETYTSALKAMNYTVKERVLIYTDLMEVIHV